MCKYNYIYETDSCDNKVITSSSWLTWVALVDGKTASSRRPILRGVVWVLYVGAVLTDCGTAGAERNPPKIIRIIHSAFKYFLILVPDHEDAAHSKTTCTLPGAWTPFVGTFYCCQTCTVAVTIRCSTPSFESNKLQMANYFFLS